MTLLRRVAARISSGVVRRASSGTKEWAEATAREVEFIESDWTALGSARILWQRRETPIASAVDVPGAARELAREIHRRTVLECAACALLALSAGWSGHMAGSATLRIDSYLLVFVAMAAMMAQVSARRAGPALLGGGAGVYRLELERQRSYHSGVWMWSRILMVGSYLLFFCSMAMAHAPAARGMAAAVIALLIPFVLAVPLNLRMVRRYQRRIDELDALERTT